jgi:hypothetical protein
MSSGSKSRRVDSKLAELDEDRPQVFQCLAQAHGARGGQVAPEHQALRRKQQARAHARFDLVFEDQAVESVEVRDAGNTDQAEDAHGGWRGTWIQWGADAGIIGAKRCGRS